MQLDRKGKDFGQDTGPPAEWILSIFESWVYLGLESDGDGKQKQNHEIKLSGCLGMNMSSWFQGISKAILPT